MRSEQNDQLGTDPCPTKETVPPASTGDFCLHIFSCHQDDSLLVNDIFQNFKLMSLFASFHTSQTHFFSFLGNSPTHPAHQKILSIYSINISPEYLGKDRRSGIDTMAIALILDTCPFRTNIQSIFFLS